MLGDNTKGGSKLIEVKHLTKSYDGHPALDDLSFTIEKGRVYGFLGPNGAGKSTTMNIMTGYIGADSGEVLINEFDILKEPEKAKRSVGYLPEIPPLYPDMTVREYLSFVSELKEIPGKERAAQVDEVLSLVRLTDVSSRLIRNLSKGYRQRTGLAAAVLGFPDIIILDEPFSGLDPVNSQVLKDVIRERIQAGKLVIFSSHQMSYVEEFCEDIVLLNHGDVVLSGNLRDIKREYGKDRLVISLEGMDLENTLCAMKEQMEGKLQIIGQRQQEVIVEMTAGNTRKEILQAMLAKEMIPETFGNYEPSLTEIFVERAGDQA